jgi:type II secretory pathway pseudopilin PulG
MKESLASQNSKATGFTLAEVIVALGIIAGVMALGVFGYERIRMAGLRAQAKAQLAQLAAEVESIKAQQGFYPTGISPESKDPWGEAILYWPHQGGYRLISLGADGKESEDDLVYEKTL